MPIRLQKQQVILIIGIVLALLSVFMFQVYLNQERIRVEKQATDKANEKLAQIQANQTTVLVAKTNISMGTVLEPDILDSQIIDTQSKEPRAVNSLARISGMIATMPIAKGEQITLDKVTHARGASGLAEITPAGKRAITVSVANYASIVNMIKPGDYADIIAIVALPVQTAGGKIERQESAFPLFQNVLLLAVGGQTVSALKSEDSRYLKPTDKKDSPYVTIALTPQEANLIAFVQEQGKIQLVTRSPLDTRTEAVAPATWETLFMHINPDYGKRIEEPHRDSVEIYRGLDKEVVVYSDSQ